MILLHPRLRLSEASCYTTCCAGIRTQRVPALRSKWVAQRGLAAATKSIFKVEKRAPTGWTNSDIHSFSPASPDGARISSHEKSYHHDS
jgi:hypothetical protein